MSATNHLGTTAGSPAVLPAGRTRGRRLLGLVCAGVLIAAEAAAASDRAGAAAEAGGGAGRALALAAVAKPKVRGNQLVPVNRQLVLAFSLAQLRLRTEPTCSALFARLGADGLQQLAGEVFQGATFELLGADCPKGAAAYTSVGSREIKLCPGFALLPLTGATVILIHEALHGAGLTEKPSDPGALTSQEINTLVKTSCRL